MRIAARRTVAHPIKHCVYTPRTGCTSTGVRTMTVRGLRAAPPARVLTDGTLTRDGGSVTAHVGRDRTKLAPIVF